ncbi:MAG: ParB/RepB/Spo0J family partition protein [Defluviitaleaceae bacterium]|nr:ParB/RepB/Spo0J family partition protein [Defluviitaleaceae bacterium]MCL2261647.1 ParB/RepB/Spo0J family partition protein [Defluviitaleaceae bacterium]
MLQNIDINKIHPHPNNPRLELGDLSELAESIKTQGILQNLTVVPKFPTGFCASCAKLNRNNAECKDGHTGAVQGKHEPCAHWENHGEYTVIIGHRRTAAAQLAGLTEVPCAIVEMDDATQIATMLLENMQREDLTRYEEAQGIQLLLDFGESVTSIAEKTGFSQTKVRTRVKLLALDKEKFKAAEARGATLEDYAELDKITDPELKNEALDVIGTPNFNWKVKSAIDREKLAEKRRELRDWLITFAEEIADDDDIDETLRVAKWLNANSPHDMPGDTDTVNYFFLDDGHNIRLLRAVPAHELEAQSEEDEAQERRNAIKSQLEEISRRAYEMRRQFIKDLNPTNHISAIVKFAAQSILSGGRNWGLANDFAVMMGFGFNNDDTEDESRVDHAVANSSEKALLVAAYVNGMDDNNYSSQYFDHSSKHKESPDTDRIYAFLLEVGYEMSDEERALQDGTHHLFSQGVV